MYGHGITKPLKNVKAKRFRKTLRKKYVDLPEIEKEVKRLLRTDNEAVSVHYEVVNIDDESAGGGKGNDGRGSSKNGEPFKAFDSNAGDEPGESGAYDVGDLFGDEVSSSDDDMDDDDDDDSRLSTTRGFQEPNESSLAAKDDVEESSKFSFSSLFQQTNQADQPSTSTSQSKLQSTFYQEDDNQQEMENEEAATSINDIPEMENEPIKRKIAELENELESIQTQLMSQQLELNSIENMSLKQRFQAIIDDLQNQEAIKRRECEELKAFLISK